MLEIYVTHPKELKTGRARYPRCLIRRVSTRCFVKQGGVAQWLQQNT